MAQALIIGPEGTEVEITITKAISRETKSIVLTRRGAGKKAPPKKVPPPRAPSPEAARRMETPEPILVATPSFLPPAGHQFPRSTTFLTHTISIQCTTSKVQIRYTLDGCEPAVHPVPAGLVYGGGGIQVRGAVTVKAVAAVQDVSGPGGWSTSAVAVATYTFEPTPPPTPSPPRSPTPPPPPSPPPPQQAEARPDEVEQAPQRRCPSPVPDTQCTEPERAGEEAGTQEAEETEAAPAEKAEPPLQVAPVEEQAPPALAEDLPETPPPVPPERRPRTASKVVQERRPGLYANVKSRLHKSTASVRAKDVNNDRFSPALAAARGGFYQHVQLTRPSTSGQLMRPSTSAPLFGGHDAAFRGHDSMLRHDDDAPPFACASRASVSSDADVRSIEHAGMHMRTGLDLGVGLPREVYSIVSPLVPNRHLAGAGLRRPGTHNAAAAQCTHNAAAACSTSAEAAPANAANAANVALGQWRKEQLGSSSEQLGSSRKVLLASSPLARRSKAWGSEVDDKGVNEDDRFVRRGKPGAAGGTAALADHRDTQRVGAGSRGAWAVLGARLETEAEAEDGDDAPDSWPHAALETDAHQSASSVTSSSATSSVHQALAASLRLVAPGKSSLWSSHLSPGTSSHLTPAAVPPGRAMREAHSTSPHSKYSMSSPNKSTSKSPLPLRSAHRRGLDSEILLEALPARSAGVTSTVACYGRQTYARETEAAHYGRNHSERSSLVRSNSAQDMRAQDMLAQDLLAAAAGGGHARLVGGGVSRHRVPRGGALSLFPAASSAASSPQSPLRNLTQAKLDALPRPKALERERGERARERE